MNGSFTLTIRFVNVGSCLNQPDQALINTHNINILGKAGLAFLGPDQGRELLELPPDLRLALDLRWWGRPRGMTGHSSEPMNDERFCGNRPANMSQLDLFLGILLSSCAIL